MQFSFRDTNITVNTPGRAALEEAVGRRLAAGQGFALLTLNLNHFVLMNASPDFARICAAQDLVVADGRPVVGLSRLAGAPVELLPGADWVVPLARLAAGAGARVALVGSTEKTLAGAAAAMRRAVPGIEIAFTHAPPMGFDPEGAQAEALLARLAAENVGLCFLALGSPRQERLAARGRALAPGVGFASIGAGLDFLAGRQRRAPRWMRRAGLEWAWRGLTSPRRLGPRYARCAAILPGRILEALRQRRRRS